MSRTPYSPPWAPHVRGYFEAPEPPLEGEAPDPYKVGATCAACGINFEQRCTTGRVKWRINLFAAQHQHKNPLRGP